MSDGRTLDDQRLSEALVALLAHDLRTPLGPLALAVSSIAEDESASHDTREIARIAEAQAARLGRLIDAVVTAARGPRRRPPAAADLAQTLEEAAVIVRGLGATCHVDAEPVEVRTDHAALRDVLASLLECASAEGAARATLRAAGGEARIEIGGGDPSVVARALADRLPDDWRAAYALFASAVLGPLGGRIEVAGDRVLVALGGVA